MTSANYFQKIIGKSRRKPNKIWVEKGDEFYNRSTKPWLQDSVEEVYTRNN